MQDYMKLDHAEIVPEQDLKKTECVYYLPMDGVVKAESSTTKLRIVFDASAKTSNGQSLNSILLTGPSLYSLLSSVISRFRTH